MMSEYLLLRVTDAKDYMQDRERKESVCELVSAWSWEMCLSVMRN